MENVPSIIVSATTPNFSAHTYNEVYAGTAATPIINGVSVTMAAGSTLKIKVKTISNATGCYLLGENNNYYYDNPIIN